MNDKTVKWLIIIGYATISLIWGSTWLVIKIGLESIPPFFGITLRFFVALCFLGLVMLLRKERLPFNRSSFFVYLQLGFMTFSTPFALVYWAEQYIPSSLASILFAFYPVVVMIVSHYLLDDERITVVKILGVLLSFAGLVVLFSDDFDLNSSYTNGMLAMLVSVLLQGTSLVLIKKFGKELSPIAMNVGGLIFGVPLMAIVAISTESFSAIHFDEKGIYSVLYLGIFGTVVAFVVYYWLLKRMQAVILSFSSYITPILAIIFGNIFLSETLSRHVVLGALLVLGGLTVVNIESVRDMFATRKRQDTD